MEDNPFNIKKFSDVEQARDLYALWDAYKVSSDRNRRKAILNRAEKLFNKGVLDIHDYWDLKAYINSANMYETVLQFIALIGLVFGFIFSVWAILSIFGIL